MDMRIKLEPEQEFNESEGKYKKQCGALRDKTRLFTHL